MSTISFPDWINSLSPQSTDGKNVYQQDGSTPSRGDLDDKASQSELDDKASLFAVTVGASNAPDGIKNAADFTCDGVDDQVEIQAALNEIQLNGGGRLILSFGTFYLTDRVNIPTNTRFTGQSISGTIIKVDDSVGDTTGIKWLLAEGGSFVEFSQFTFDGNKQRTSTEVDFSEEGIDIETPYQYGWVNNVYIKNLLGEGIDIDGLKKGFVHNCIIEDCAGNGIHYSHGDAELGIITDNIVINCAHGRGDINTNSAGIVVSADRMTVSDNHVYNSYRGIRCQVGSSREDININGNLLIDNANQAIWVGRSEENEGGDRVSIKNNHIHVNFVSGVTKPFAIYVTSDFPSVQNNVIWMPNSDDGCIKVGGVDTVSPGKVTDNLLRGGQQTILIEDRDQMDISDNTIIGTGDVGINIGSSQTTMVQNNNVNGKIRVRFDSEDTFLINNKANEYEDNGVGTYIRRHDDGKIKTFNIGLRGRVDAGEYTFSSSVSEYSINGNEVTINIELRGITEVSAGSGDIEIFGLPEEIRANILTYLPVGRFDNLELPASAISVISQIRSDGTIRIQTLGNNESINTLSVSSLVSGETRLNITATYHR